MARRPLWRPRRGCRRSDARRKNRAGQFHFWRREGRSVIPSEFEYGRGVPFFGVLLTLRCAISNLNAKHETTHASLAAGPPGLVVFVFKPCPLALIARTRRRAFLAGAFVSDCGNRPGALSAPLPGRDLHGHQPCPHWLGRQFASRVSYNCAFRCRVWATHLALAASGAVWSSGRHLTSVR